MCGEEDCLVELLAFIDSLPDETCKDSLQVPETCKEDTDSFASLEEAANEYSERVSGGHNYRDLTCGFIAGAKWMRKKDVEDMYLSDNRHFLKCYEQGKVDLKVEMMKDAVECEVADLNGEIYNNCIEKGMTDEDKVKIVIIKDND